MSNVCVVSRGIKKIFTNHYHGLWRFVSTAIFFCKIFVTNISGRLSFSRLKANVATYSLLGVEPIEAVIDKLILIFFGSILQNKDTIEYRIIERQISMDKPTGKSFASLVYDKLRKYKLPDLMDLMENPIEKHKWKKLVKQQIEIYWEEAWIEEKQTKSTLKFLNLQHPLFENSHQVWKTVPKNSMEVKKAEVKARLLTGTYMLKETKAKFSRNTDTRSVNYVMKKQKTLSTSY